ncbi:hypothetical protein SODALDRAFT_361662 [Sodiomyces alkalinus F11]|uniref:Uncharacterized protein n=1 Tax=Sodiomyces alkalinus (strain CBS 110278 / VKM F-3762 / F11) TaxID=1314773 RepID=A0A3N2PQQ1_SODAK|nr:hypothetical protein SODALDRAFT_361662 [Sodiomyces alkalinus F11]ROT36839.1 hypothetical protein SODALDRAFT_361662 [Sodiomyces alkalinus F11]
MRVFQGSSSVTRNTVRFSTNSTPSSIPHLIGLHFELPTTDLPIQPTSPASKEAVFRLTRQETEAHHLSARAHHRTVTRQIALFDLSAGSPYFGCLDLNTTESIPTFLRRDTGRHAAAKLSASTRTIASTISITGNTLNPPHALEIVTCQSFVTLSSPPTPSHRLCAPATVLKPPCFDCVHI